MTGCFLSSYNLFFQRERKKIFEGGENNNDNNNVHERKFAFDEMGKIIGARWRALSKKDRQQYEDLAVEDSYRYRREMEVFNEAKRKKIHHIEKVGFKTTTTSSSPTTMTTTDAAVAAATEDMFPPPPESQEELGRSIDTSQDDCSKSAISAAAAAEMDTTFCRYPPTRPTHFSQYENQYPIFQNRRGGGYPSQFSPPPFYRNQRQPPPPPMPSYEAEPNNTNTNNNMFPVPPGMELMLPDRNGVERKFRVQYACYSMSREAAHEYIERLSGNAPPPPHPSAQQDSHYSGRL